MCLFTTSFLPVIGGAEHSGDVILRGLMARGHQAMVLAQHTGETPTSLPYAVRHYRRPPHQHLWPELLAWPLTRACRNWKPDLILAFDSYPCGYAATWIKRRLGVPVLTSSRGGDVQLSFHALGKPRVRTCLARGYQRSDRIIAISRWGKQRVEEIVGTAAPPIDVIYNGIDLAEHDRLRDQARARPPALPVKPPFILHLAGVKPHKQQLTALRAVHMASDEFKRRGVTYAIVGGGRGLPDVERLVAQLQLQDLVACLGPRSGVEKAWLLAHACFFVAASLGEGFGNVLIEALAAGLPILASDIPTHREVVAPHGAGLFFKTADASDMAAQMVRMFDLAPALRPAALAARTRFPIERMIDGYENACLRCLNGRRGDATRIMRANGRDIR